MSAGRFGHVRAFLCACANRNHIEFAAKLSAFERRACDCRGASVVISVEHSRVQGKMNMATQMEKQSIRSESMTPGIHKNYGSLRRRGVVKTSAMRSVPFDRTANALYERHGPLLAPLKERIEVAQLGERSLRETGEAMGLSVTAVKARLFQGRRALRNSRLHMFRNDHSADLLRQGPRM